MSTIKKVKPIKSNVPGHEGTCAPVWLNTNEIFVRIDGGATGFFKEIKYFLGFIPYRAGKEFHGIIKKDCVEEIKWKGK